MERGTTGLSAVLSYQVRDGAFTSLIRQEVAFFDVRAPGTITSQLADDAAMLHAFAGEPIRTLTISVSSVVVGLVISFVYMWYVIGRLTFRALFRPPSLTRIYETGRLLC
jgi:ATP-binding cassette subfamily B (MDR/TAP) protein 1